MVRLSHFLKRVFGLSFASNTLAPTQQTGWCAEKLAAKYLRQQGLREITARYAAPCGEVDLIMWDKEELVFIEVRFRAGENYEAALASIHPGKLKKIFRTADHYLLKNHLQGNVPCRFDVVIVTGSLREPIINWLKNAAT